MQDIGLSIRNLQLCHMLHCSLIMLLYVIKWWKRTKSGAQLQAQLNPGTIRCRISPSLAHHLRSWDGCKVSVTILWFQQPLWGKEKSYSFSILSRGGLGLTLNNLKLWPQALKDTDCHQSSFLVVRSRFAWIQIQLTPSICNLEQIT